MDEELRLGESALGELFVLRQKFRKAGGKSGRDEYPRYQCSHSRNSTQDVIFYLHVYCELILTEDFNTDLKFWLTLG